MILASLVDFLGEIVVRIQRPSLLRLFGTNLEKDYSNMTDTLQFRDDERKGQEAEARDGA